MARKARVRGDNGIYHILVRGKSNLFNEQSDYEQFVGQIKRLKERDFFELYAYSLNAECVHLIIKEGLRDFSHSLRDILATYASYFKTKYALTEDVYNGRFLSEPIADELLTDAVRYVLKTGGINNFNGYVKADGLTDSEPVLMLIGSLFDFKIYLNDAAENKYLSGEKKAELTDLELKDKIRALFSGVQANELQQLEDKEYKILLKRITAIEGASIRQIARVLGVSKSLVERAKKS